MTTIRNFRVTRTETVAPGMALLTLEPADDAPMFPFLAGQFVMLRVNAPEVMTIRRSYSIASPPSASASSFEVAVKGVGETSRLIVGSKVGDTLGVQGPFGKFTLDTSDAPLVLIAGGIGITPIRSMLLELAGRGFERDAWLFYSCRSLADMPFEQEFLDLAVARPRFRFVPILTRETLDGWSGETGHLDAGMLKRHVPDLTSCRFYACGPTDLVDAAKTMLDAEGIDPNASFRQEIFG
ncbi:MAG: FAD-binding oxidoreductase [Patescibacteria group bacterium]